jgi:transposase-like protein
MLSSHQDADGVPMPRKSETKRPAKTVTKAVKRHLEGGESVVALARECDVSRATFYNWVTNYRTQLIEANAKAGMSPASVEKADRLTLAAELAQLRLENARLKKKLFEVLLNHNLL